MICCQCQNVSGSFPLIEVIALAVSLFAVLLSWIYHLKSTISDHLLNKAQEANAYVHNDKIRGLNNTTGISLIVSSIITAKQILNMLTDSKLLKIFSPLIDKQKLINIFYLSLDVHIRSHLWSVNIVHTINISPDVEDNKQTMLNQVNDCRAFLQKSHDKLD